MYSSRIDRRDFLKSAAGAAVGSCLLGCTQRGNSHAGSDKQVNIYSWADYVAPNVIPEFERRYGVRVIYDTFSSNEALLAKMQAGGNEYDVIVPTSYIVMQLKKLNVLQPIDHDRIPNLKNVMRRFLNPAYDRHLQVCVPYTWGTTGIGFNSTAFDSPANYPTDFDVFWDEKLRGRMALLDDSRECIGMALKRRGHSFNTEDTKEIESAAHDLIAQKPLTMCYTSDQMIVQLAAGDSLVALSYNGDVYQAAAKNSSIHYVIPRSGASLWVDNMCIPKGAPHADNAYKWLNFILEPEIAAANAKHTRYATPNQAAFGLLGDDMRNDPNLYPDDKLLQRCDELADVGPLVFLYDKLWTEIKCS